ncbi:hypothetical protein CZ787_04875 [Halomonas citrativorans]|uniref:Uncharacterized protein n=1 Tax=Halomonas citrativorans TaxID=2742612 RepID=A0A1R4HTV7_9GAMM|nr:hypothetical protein CZ787_04875 [Halomonas citrativorans]
MHCPAPLTLPYINIGNGTHTIFNVLTCQIAQHLTASMALAH